MLGIRLDEEVEGVDHRHVRGEIDLDGEFVGALGKNEPRQPVAVRVLLPIDEVVGRRDLQRIAGNPRPRVRRGAQSDRLGSQLDQTVVAIAGDVTQGGENRQG
jgi:hypothetical protein